MILLLLDFGFVLCIYGEKWQTVSVGTDSALQQPPPRQLNNENKQTFKMRLHM